MQDIIHMFQSDHAYDLILRLFSVKDCCACNSCRHEHYNHAQHKQDCEQTSLSHSLFQVAPFPFLITRKKTSYICPYFSTTPPPVQIANVLNLCFLRFFICIANIMIHAGISFYRMTYNCAVAAGFRAAVTLPEKESIYI